MAQLFEISNWSEQPWWNTGGTRNKKVYENPNTGDLFYFKESFNKGQRDYKYEFWSEIIASEVGLLLGFDVLPYHIAIRKDTVGCISKFMIDPAKEELVEGGKYLQAFDNTFDPADRNLRHQYDFELILSALEFFSLENYFGHMLDTILFDAFIGNSDRHQENWAIINVHSDITKSMDDFYKNLHERVKKAPKMIKRFLEKYLVKNEEMRPELIMGKWILSKDRRFAPIYDSGCSFGRELTEDRVNTMIADENVINKYLDKGLAEIHWDNEKIDHFQLIENILIEDDFSLMMLESMERSLHRFDETKISAIVSSVDQPLLASGNKEGLPDVRKQLIFKLLILRRDRIQSLYDFYKK